MMYFILKSFGVLLLIVSSYIVGDFYTSKMRLRPTQLQDLQYSLNILENEISYMYKKLPEAFGSVCEKINSPVTAIFRTMQKEISIKNNYRFVEVWEKVLDKALADLALQKDDIGILRTLGETMGKTDIEGQTRCIRLAISQLKDNEKSALYKSQKIGNAYRKISVILGIGIAIILF